MAKFEYVLPTEVIEDIEKIYRDTEKIFGAMTRAGAEVAMRNILHNVPDGIKNSEMLKTLKISEVYRTPSDDGINSKVAFYGYFENENGEVVPAPLVANVFEYGRSGLPFPKQPFLRKSFRKSEITKAMLKAQAEASDGLLDEGWGEADFINDMGG